MAICEIAENVLNLNNCNTEDLSNYEILQINMTYPSNTICIEPITFNHKQLEECDTKVSIGLPKIELSILKLETVIIDVDKDGDLYITTSRQDETLAIYSKNKEKAYTIFKEKCANRKHKNVDEISFIIYEL